MKNLIYLLLAGVFVSCSGRPVDQDDLNYVKANTWKWDKGFKIGEGDFVSFDSDRLAFDIFSDTIYFRNRPRAIVKELHKKYNEMTIRSLDGKNEGVYINIEEFTK